MKPTNLHITTDKQSAYFNSPYHSSSSSTSPDIRSPLLPTPTPNTLESGSNRYPFPAGNAGGMALATRLKFMFGGGAGGKRSAWGGVAKRFIWLAMLSGIVWIVLVHGGKGVDLPTSRYSSGSILHAPISEHKYTAPEVSPAKWKLPFSAPEPQQNHPSVHSDTLPEVYVKGLAQGRREIDISSDSLPVEATLRERLEVWRHAPGGRGEVEGEVELGGFVSWNLEQCSTIREQHNTHMIQHSANVWATMNRTTLHQNRMELIEHMEGVLEKGLHEDYGVGRGIVLVAGNADTLQRVKWMLQMLRSYGSELPVQIYHFPSEKPDPESDIVRELKELGAELVEAKGQEKDAGKNKSYHLKAIAVVQCPWREVLYLDSDSIPTRDPEYMFESPNYLRLGIFATPDYWKTSANNPMWAIMGVKCRNEWEMETGQMFIDKKLHLDVFLLVKYMLERHEWWFWFSDGDKDIFRWALLMLRKRWAVPGRWVGAGGLPSGTASGDFCAHTMVQHDSYGDPLFVHYNLLKQIPSGVGRGFSWGRTKQMPLFNLWPASPATARLGETAERPEDDGRRGLGDVDCDMLADADEAGVAREPAKEMVMRRAARERGIKVKYHGGWISALCIDLDYIDPRPEDRKVADRAAREISEAHQREKDESWNAILKAAEDDGLPEPVRPEEETKAVVPNWDDSPIEILQWGDEANLADFERKIYDFGFVPSGPGF